MTDQRPKTIFITGSSSGLGRAAATLFASRGWKVIATMRNPEREVAFSTLSGVALFPLDITDRAQIEHAATFIPPEQIAEVVYEAATDGKDQLRYVAGADAKATYAVRLQLGDEAFRKAIRQQFFGKQAETVSS